MDTLKKWGAGVAIGAALAGGTLTAVNRPDCTYELTHQGETVCLSQKEVDAIKQSTGTWESVQTWDE